MKSRMNIKELREMCKDRIKWRVLLLKIPLTRGHGGRKVLHVRWGGSYRPVY